MKVSRFSIRELLNLNILWCSLNFQYAALLPIVIPTQILLFVDPSQVGSAEQATFLGWLSTIASVVSLFMQPLVGELSDQTRCPLGRRRPYIVVGGLLMIISAPVLASANTILLFLVGLTILHIGNNILTPAYQSLVPDRVPKEQRGEASGYVGAMTIFGNIASLGLAAWLLGGIHQHAYNKDMIRHGADIYYIVTAIVMLIGLLITVIGIREAPFLPSNHRRSRVGKRIKRGFMQNWVEPWHNYNFTVVFLTRALIMLGLAMFMTFIEYYFARVQHITNFVQVTAIVALLALGGGVVSGIVSGIYSDHLRRRAPLVSISTLCMSLASFAFVILPSNLATWLWPLGVLFGLGYGAYKSVDWALSIDALPSLDEAGKDLGLWDASATLSAIIAPLLGSLIINVANAYGQTDLGYRLVFIVAAFFLVIAAVCVLFVREGRYGSRHDPKMRSNGWIVCLFANLYESGLAILI